MRRAIDEVCDAQYFILGPKVAALESAVAKYCGAEHAIGVSSGTDALIVALMAMGVGPGDAVITSPYSFFATAGSVARLGATPVFADIDPVTFNLSPARVEELLARWPARFAGLKPKAIMPVHLYGQAADMAPLMELARRHGLRVVEDACQAIGAEYPAPAGGAARKVGAIGDAGCFSFFPSKNLGGFGDGGMVVTRDPELAARIVRLRNHGSEPKYYHATIGGNFRLDALQAAVLSVKLPHLEAWHEGRCRNAATYDAHFASGPVRPPAAVYRGRGVKRFHVFNQYVVRVPERDAVREALTKEGIGTEVYYPVPLHVQECFRHLGYKPGDMPESERAAAESLALPIYPELTEEMLATVCEAVLRLAGRAA